MDRAAQKGPEANLKCCNPSEAEPETYFVVCKSSLHGAIASLGGHFALLLYAYLQNK